MNAIIVNLLCLAFLCGDVSTIQPRYVQTQINGVPMAWANRNIEYQFVRGCTPLMKASAKAAFAKWAAVSNLTFTEVKSIGYGIVIFKSKYVYGKALAETRIFDDGRNRPQLAEIHINAASYKFHRGDPWYVFQTKPDVDLDRLFLHEIGHAIGLKHSLDVDAVMHDPFHKSQDVLHTDDIIGVNAIYP